LSPHTDREIEIKFAFETEEDFWRFVKCFAVEKRGVVQTNYYFDTDDGHLGKMGFVVRLRRARGRCFVTIKGQRNAVGDGIFDVAEFETEVQVKECEKILQGKGSGEIVARLFPDLPPEVKKVLASCNLVLLAQSRTRRFRAHIGKGTVAVADETVFENGKKDYEVEVEDKDTETARRVLLEALMTCGAKAVVQTQSKFDRAMANRKTA
jgi:uncharacterized protein YjbK